MGYDPAHRLLKDGTRRRIIEFLGRREPATYTEILAELGISTGKLNYHLRVLAPLLDKKDQTYSLNELGSNAHSLLKGLTPTTPSADNRFRPVSWILLLLSVLAMYYGFFSNSLISTLLGFLSTAFLIIAVFATHYSRNLEFEMRHILALSLLGLLFSLPTLWLLMQSNPFRANLQMALTPPLLNSIIFFPTLLAWSLRTRREWLASTLTVSSISITFLAIFTVNLSITGNLFSFFSPQTVVTCTGSACETHGFGFYLPLQPIFLLLTVFSRAAGLRNFITQT